MHILTYGSILTICIIKLKTRTGDKFRNSSIEDSFKTEEIKVKQKMDLLAAGGGMGVVLKCEARPVIWDGLPVRGPSGSVRIPAPCFISEDLSTLLELHLPIFEMASLNSQIKTCMVK